MLHAIENGADRNSFTDVFANGSKMYKRSVFNERARECLQKMREESASSTIPLTEKTPTATVRTHDMNRFLDNFYDSYNKTPTMEAIQPQTPWQKIEAKLQKKQQEYYFPGQEEIQQHLRDIEKLEEKEDKDKYHGLIDEKHKALFENCSFEEGSTTEDWKLIVSEEYKEYPYPSVYSLAKELTVILGKNTQVSIRPSISQLEKDLIYIFGKDNVYQLKRDRGERSVEKTLEERVCKRKLIIERLVKLEEELNIDILDLSLNEKNNRHKLIISPMKSSAQLTISAALDREQIQH